MCPTYNNVLLQYILIPRHNCEINHITLNKDFEEAWREVIIL